MLSWLPLLFVFLVAAQPPYGPATNPACGSHANALPLLCARGVIEAVTAFYGTPNATCPPTRGKCDQSNFQAYANATCLGKAACTLLPNGEPCSNVPKYMAATVRCSEAPGGWVPAPVCALSNVLGSHMVLQRAPRQGRLWGWAAPGTAVDAAFAGATHSAVADATGLWRVELPPTNASAVGATVAFNCSTGETFNISDVLFGDVHLCGGQSNSQFTVQQLRVGDGYNATAELEASAAYPLVRTMTAGQPGTAFGPLVQLPAAPALPWSVAGPASIGHGDWAATSAVCWFYGKALFDATGVPQGLVASSWGGTVIEGWVQKK